MKNSFFWTLLLCFVSGATFGQPDTTLLSPSKFEQAIAAPNAQLVDVRTPDEYKKGHIDKFQLANWNKRDEFATQVKLLDSTKAVYVYCAAGVRSHAAAEYLRSQGFKLVYELDGGINRWKEEKKPLKQ